MSKHRIVKSDFWDDDYIVNLPVLERYLFLYLLTNEKTNILGIYEITLRRIEFDTSLDLEIIKPTLDKFAEKDKIHYIDQYILMVNFHKHQNPSGTMVTGIKKLLNNLPKEVIDFILSKKSEIYNRLYRGYLIDYIYPYINKDKDNNKGKGKKAHLFVESQTPESFISNLPKTFLERNSDINLESVLEDVLLYEKKIGKPYKDHCAAMETFIKRDRSGSKTYLNTVKKNRIISPNENEIQYPVGYEDAPEI